MNLQARVEVVRKWERLKLSQFVTKALIHYIAYLEDSHGDAYPTEPPVEDGPEEDD